MNNDIEENAVLNAVEECALAQNADVKAAQENVQNAAALVRDFLAAETEREKELSQKIASYNTAFTRLTASAERLCEVSETLNKNLDDSCKALGVIENAPQLLSDVNTNFSAAFTSRSDEIQKTLQRVIDRLLSVSHQCDFFKTSPKPWTEMVRLYSARIESLFGVLESEKKQTLEAQSKIRRAYFLIDCSGSMRGKKIKAVNTTLPQVIAGLEKHGWTHSAVLAFSETCAWMNGSQSTEIAAFQWQELTADGITNLGAAFFELFKALSRCPQNSPAPLIAVLSDGEPTDDWETPLAALAALPCFKAAARYAWTLEYDEEIDALAAFTGNAANVIAVEQAARLLPALQKIFDEGLET